MVYMSLINWLKHGLQKEMCKRPRSNSRSHTINIVDPLTSKLEREFYLLKPAERTGENRKLVRAYHGPYRVI